MNRNAHRRPPRLKRWVSLIAPAVLTACGGGGGGSGSSPPLPLGITLAQEGALSLVAGNVYGPGNADGLLDSTARFDFAGGVFAFDASGNMYLAESVNRTIRKISPTGLVTTLAGKAGESGSADGTGAQARFKHPYAMAVDAANQVYVVDDLDHTVRKITPSGVVSTLAGLAGSSGSTDGMGSVARFHTPRGIAVDSSANVYVAEAGNYTLRLITPEGQVSTIVGSAGDTGLSSGKIDGTGTAAHFATPYGVAIDASGNAYVADTSAHTIRKIELSTRVTSTWAGTIQSLGSVDGTGAQARFNAPQGVAVDTSGNVYVADSTNHTLRKIDSNRGVTTVAGSAGQLGQTDGSGAQARFHSPDFLAFDPQGNLYVGHELNNVVRKFHPATGTVSTYINTSAKPGWDEGTGTAARFNLPSGVAGDASGNVYVADSSNHTIRKISASGVVSTYAGRAGNPGTDNASGSAARFSTPAGVATDAQGNVYVADTNNHLIRKISASGQVTTLAGDVGLSGTQDGSGTGAQFNAPSALALDQAGNVYVSDTNNHAIRRITPTGVVSTWAGSSGNSGSSDGNDTAASFNKPIGIAVDASGNVYVADNGNHTLRKIDSNRKVSTLAGSASQTGNANGTGSAARFWQPYGLAVDAFAYIYVADQYNHTLRQVTPAGVVTTLTGQNGVIGFTPGALPGVLSYPKGIAVVGNALYISTSNGIAKVARSASAP